jgi:LemA protein
MMKKVLISLAAIALLLGIYTISVYNSMVSLSQQVESSWAQVQNVYQRRIDLIPNLVSTVKGYAKHERETLLNVTQARAGARQIPMNIPTDPAQFQQFEQAQQSLGGALSRLMVVVEKYPDLKANQNFLALQAELAGTENRIAVERRRFNQVTQEYNTYIKKFPHSLMATRFHFESKLYFTAEPAANQAPKVNFGE